MKQSKVNELMTRTLVEFLDREDMWVGDVGIVHDGISVRPHGEAPTDEITQGVMRIWFEGPLNHALNHGVGDPTYTLYNGIVRILESYGYYPEFGNHCELNVYPKTLPGR